MKKISVVACLLLIFLMLCYPAVCLEYSAYGLLLWFEKMVPALFPFMILSGIIIQMNLTEELVLFIKPVLQPLFQVRASVIYGIFIGFLCGFPMGAKVAAQLLKNGKISHAEAEYLLCFCNNIGPAYFLGFVLPTLQLENFGWYLFGMYGLPLLYGVFLRYTLYRRKIPFAFMQQSEISKSAEKKANQKAGQSIPVKRISTGSGFLTALDEAVSDSIHSIVTLGGYMIIFNALNLLPCILVGEKAVYFSPFLEISGGIGFLGAAAPLLILSLLPLGGCCCLAQTNTMIRGTSLSFRKYLSHKLVLTLISMVYYRFLL